MSNDLDFDSLMNGHLDKSNNENSGISNSGSSNANEQSAQTQASFQNKKPEGVNQYLYESEKGLSLCAQLIANGDSNTSVARLLAEIKHTIEHEFLQLAKQDDNTTGAYTYAQLLLLEKQLNEIAAFPHLESSRSDVMLRPLCIKYELRQEVLQEQPISKFWQLLVTNRLACC